MKEIELKILEINVRKVSKTLLVLGTRKIPSRLVISIPYDYPDGRLEKEKKSFRLRKLGKSVELTAKVKKRADRIFKIRDEYQTNVSDFDLMQKILQSIGFIPTHYQEKKRTTFLLQNMHCEIDQYPDIPAYLEIEGEKNNIVWLLPKLGYTLKDTNTLTVNEVLEKYNVHAKNQKF
jgi:adenylate cyclase class 2